MHFDLVDLRLFLLVAEAGSITAGAARAGLSLPAASARVAGLEARAGVGLLHRGARGVRPTAAGLVLLRHARLVMAEAERLRGAVGAFGQGPAGVVRLWANTAGAARAAGPIAAFLAAHPAVDVDLVERRSEGVAEGVRDGLAELGLAAGHAAFAGLETRPAGTDRLVVAVPPGHPLEAAPHLTLAALAGEGMVGLGVGNALQAHVEDQARRAGLQLHVRVQAAGPEAACRMVALGVGLAVVPDGAATAVRTVPLAEPWAERQLFLLARRFATLSVPAGLLTARLVPAAG